MNGREHLPKKNSRVFYRTSIVVLTVLVAYPLFGGLLVSLVLPVTGTENALLRFERQVLPEIRTIQVVGQVLLLALPVFFLAGLRTGEKWPFSGNNFFFLGLGRKVAWHGLFLAVAGVLLLQPLIYAVVEITGRVLPYLGDFGNSLIENQERLERFLMYIAGADSAHEFVAVAFVVAVVPAFCEELFFRGYIQKNYMDSLSPAGGVLLTGFIFGLFHFSPANLVPLTCMGWYLGYVYYKSQNLFVPVAVHFCNNMLSLFLLQLQRRNPDVYDVRVATDDMIGWTILPVVVSLLLFFFVMRRFSRFCSAEVADNRFPL